MNGSGGAAQGAMQTSLNNQGAAAGQIGQQVNNLNSQSGMLNAPLQATTNALSGGIGALTPGYNSNISSLFGSNGNFASQTGVDANTQGSNLVNYASNTGGTQLSGANSGLQGFYQGEMSNGLNQQTQLNAQNQLNQQFQQSLNQTKAHAAPGQNINAAERQSKNDLLSASTNLAGNLAGQNQQTMQQGAQGLASTASNLDSQKLNMLTQAFQTGQGMNSTQLQNILSILGFGQSTLNQGLGAAGQASSNYGAAASAEQGLFSGYGGQAQQFGDQAAANRKSGGLGGLLGAAGGLLSPIKL